MFYQCSALIFIIQFILSINSLSWTGKCNAVNEFKKNLKIFKLGHIQLERKIMELITMNDYFGIKELVSQGCHINSFFFMFTLLRLEI